jgi:hypothetical protein
MFADLWNWIISSWWVVILAGAACSFFVAFIFNNIIQSEMDRGGEEYAERAITRVQKWTTTILILSVSSSIGAIAFKVLDVIGII